MAKIKRLAFLVLMTVTLALCGMFMTACSKVGQVKAATLLYDGTYVTWDGVKNAESYMVTVDGKVYDTEETKYRAPAKASAESVEISVTAIGKKGKQGETTTRTFYRLAKMEQNTITFDENGVMSWDEVEGADEYIISLDNEEFKVTDTEFDEFVYGKVNNIKIKPSIADGSSFSTWSDKMSKMYLGAPTNIKYDGTTITWTGSNVDECLGFALYIDGNIHESLVTSKQYAYNAGENSFSVSIVAVGEDIVNGRSYSSPESEVKDFIYLPRLTQEELEYDEDTGVLSWPQITHAKSYLVKLKDSAAPQTVTKNSISLPAGEYLSVSIMAVADTGETYFSMYSEARSFYILKAPQPSWSGATLEAGIKETVVSWNQITGATGYSVNIKKYSAASGALEKNEVYGDLTAKARDFEYAFEETGKYELTVQATTTNENMYSSSLSEKFTITRLASPTEPQNSVISDPNDLSKGFELKWTSVYGASGYRIYKDDAPIEMTGSANETSKRIFDIVEANETKETKIDYRVQSLGSVNHTTKTIFLPSINTTEKLLHVEITVAAKPANVVFSGWDATWTGVAENANGYSVRLDGSYTPANNTTYSMKAIEAAGDHRLAVCTRGNGGKYLPSNYTEDFLVIKLNAPKQLKIGTTVDEGKLTWEGDDRCSSYEITIKGTSQSFKTSAVNYAIAEYISKEGVNIGVTAVKNDYSPDRTAYYLTSQESEVVEFKKLAAPTFGEVLVSNGKLIWNAPYNCGAFQPNYYVYKGDDTLYKEQLTSNEKNLPQSEFPAGKYSFKVQAIGDGTHYINSDLAESEPCDFRILETPTVERTQNGYKWNPIDYATSYVFMVDNESVDAEMIKYDADTNTYSYIPTQFTTEKTYNISVYAVGDGGRTLVNSYTHSFAQETKPLNAPYISVAYSADRYEINGEIIVTVTRAVDFASGYVYEVGNSSSNLETGLEYRVTPVAPDKFDVAVYAVGGQFDNTGVYRLNSPKSSHTSSNPNSITILSKPSEASITKDTNGNLEWAYVEGCYGYEVLVTYLDNENNEQTVSFDVLSKMNTELSSSALSAKGVLVRRIVKVQISAKGKTESGVIASEYAIKEWQL